MSAWKDGYDLSLAFHCMRQLEPEKYQNIIAACHKSRILRKHIIKRTRSMMLRVLTKLEMRQ